MTAPKRAKQAGRLSAAELRDRERNSVYGDAYLGFSKTLRGWLVAYGIGAPVLLATQPALLTALSGFFTSRRVVLLFLLGVLFQILQAFTYRTAMWRLYSQELGLLDESAKAYARARWVSESYGLECFFDAATVAAFAVATAAVLLSQPAPKPQPVTAEVTARGSETMAGRRDSTGRAAAPATSDGRVVGLASNEGVASRARVDRSDSSYDAGSKQSDLIRP